MPTNAQLDPKEKEPFMIRRLAIAAMLALVIPSSEYVGQQIAAEASACEALMEAPNVTITYAKLKPAGRGVPGYCYVQGSISGRIRFVMQLPLRKNWNRRLLNIGDGGKDGVLNLSNDRLTQGYAVANSNSGHDSGVEPNASFADNLEEAIDVG